MTPTAASGSSVRWTRTCAKCGDARCSVPIRLTRSEYEGIRSEPTRFALALNHENPEIDSLIAENERFATIEKSFGVASRIARASDPADSGRSLDWGPAPGATLLGAPKGEEAGPRARSPGPGAAFNRCGSRTRRPCLRRSRSPNDLPAHRPPAGHSARRPRGGTSVRPDPCAPRRP